MKFNFEDRFDSIDEALQELKESISRITQDPLDLTRSKWATHLSRALEFYNVTTEEEEEDPRKINIPETKGHHEVQG